MHMFGSEVFIFQAAVERIFLNE